MASKNQSELDYSILSVDIQRNLLLKFFTNYDKGLLRTDISENEILSLSHEERYNLFYLSYMKAISLIPTVEMAKWVNENFNPDYDVCGGAGNLGFALGIPTTDSHFRLESEFGDRMNALEQKVGKQVAKPDFTVCANTQKLTANHVARMENVNTVVGSWILVQNPDKTTNEALRLLDLAKKNPNAISQLSPTKKVSKKVEEIMKKGALGVPNGIHLKGLLDNSNLVFIGNYNIHTPKLLKELCGMHKHVTFSQEDLPFFIIDKQWLRGNKNAGFIKFFEKMKGK